MASCIFLALAHCPLEELLHIGPQLWWGPRSNSASSSSHCGGLCAGEWARLLSSRALWHLLLCPQDLFLHQSQLQEGAQAPGWSLVMDWLSCSIFSSKTMVVARAFQWASLASASWISVEGPPLSPCGSCFMSGVQPELPLVACPLSTSGSFSKRTLCPC